MYHFFLYHTNSIPPRFSFFFLNDPAPPEIYPFSLHDALPISLMSSYLGMGFLPCARQASPAGKPRLHNARAPVRRRAPSPPRRRRTGARALCKRGLPAGDRKSTRLNSSHSQISYAVFCLKKKK